MTSQSEEQRIGKIETDIAVINTKIDDISNSLQGIHSAMDRQTEILNKFINYQQKQEHLEEIVGELKKDYRASKETLLSGMGWSKGFMYAGTFALAFGQALIS